MSADALDDDFLLDETIVKRSFSDIEEDGDLSESEVKGEFVNEDLVAQGSDDQETEAPAKKKRKKKPSTKFQNRSDAYTVLSDLLSAKEYSGLELKEFPEFTQERTDETLHAFIKSMYKTHWEKALTKKLQPGTPRLIYLCSSAIRAVEVIRVFKASFKGMKIAKCFAKHLKVADQMEFLAREKTAVAVGTPNRVLKLIQEGGLKLTGLDYFVVDTTHKDKKQLHFFDLAEVTMDIKALLDALPSGIKIVGF